MKNKIITGTIFSTFLPKILMINVNHFIFLGLSLLLHCLYATVALTGFSEARDDVVEICTQILLAAL